MYQFAALLAGLLLKKKAQGDYEKQLRGGITDRRKNQDKTNADNRVKIMEELQQFRPESRQAKRDDGQQAIQDQLTKDLTASLQENQNANVTSGISDAMLQDRAARTRASADKASSLAALLSRYRAPIQSRQDERFRSRGFASDRRGISAKGKRRDVVDQNWLNYIRPNPGADIGSGMLMAYGSGGGKGIN